MTSIETLPELRFLSELYALDAPEAVFLSEYPSSNSNETIFRNDAKFIIHDPFPPPPRELLTSLGPHHLMFCWGTHLPVTSQIAPPPALLQHWENLFGVDNRPLWKDYCERDSFITLFPHQSIPASQQLVDPESNYAIHSKEVLAEIECRQAAILDAVEFPCIVKLSHGYAGLGNFVLRNSSDQTAMDVSLAKHWPDATLVMNSMIEDIQGDFGVQFYLRRDGSVVWLGLTEQHFNEDCRWCGGTYSADLQASLLEPFSPIVCATAEHLHQQGYFGVVGVDILRNSREECFLVDVNPRLTGITPFLMASRMLDQKLIGEGIYQASFRFNGSLDELLNLAESHSECRMLVLSAFEQRSDDTTTICHLSVSSQSQAYNREILSQLAQH